MRPVSAHKRTKQGRNCGPQTNLIAGQSFVSTLQTTHGLKGGLEEIVRKQVPAQIQEGVHNVRLLGLLVPWSHKMVFNNKIIHFC